MADRGSGCWSVILMLPSAFVWAFRQAAWQRSFPRPHKLRTAEEAMEVVAELTSDHGGTGAALPYAQRALEINPTDIQAAKFMAHWLVTSHRFSEALPYLKVAAEGAHPDSIYIVMLRQTLAALGSQTEARDDNTGSTQDKARHF